jgi:geranylgeranyl reductase family protein
MSEIDVAIVGGGPAGTYCAFNLARQGLKPVIFDHSHPREKPCGGGISPRTIEKFPFLENFRLNGSTFGDFVLISCIDTRFKTNEFENGFRISRRFLDEQLLDIAIESGATLIRERVTELKKIGDLWEITTDKRQIFARAVVGADGVNSVVRRKILGSIANKHLALTYGYLVTGIRREDATIKFLAEIPGYIWVFPGRNTSNIGIGSDLENGSRLKALLDRFIGLNLPKVKIISSYAAMVPSASDVSFFKQSCCGVDWILIGDAAGHVDPISGGGIMYALWGGELAAKAITSKKIDAFDTLWRSAFGYRLEDRCKIKSKFYDPFQSTLYMMVNLGNKTFFE